MKRSLKAIATSDLVQRFVDLSVAQDIALLANESAKVGRLANKVRGLLDELKSRHGDERRLLVDLYRHPNYQVRLNAAKATLAIAPEAARQTLQALTENKLYYQALDAGMCLWALDEGIFKPT